MIACMTARRRGSLPVGDGRHGCSRGIDVVIYRAVVIVVIVVVLVIIVAGKVILYVHPDVASCWLRRLRHVQAISVRLIIHGIVLVVVVVVLFLPILP